MWKRDQAPKPESETLSAPASTQAASQTATPPAPATQYATPSAPSSIGRSVVIKGELSGTEDLTIEGTVDGTIELRGNKLTVGPGGQVQASISAKTIAVLGKVTGDITATEKISILEDGSVEGDLTAPSIAIADGAHFRGSVDMQRSNAGASPTTSHGKPNGQAGTATVAH